MLENRWLTKWMFQVFLLKVFIEYKPRRKPTEIFVFYTLNLHGISSYILFAGIILLLDYLVYWLLDNS